MRFQLLVFFAYLYFVYSIQSVEIGDDASFKENLKLNLRKLFFSNVQFNSFYQVQFAQQLKQVLCELFEEETFEKTTGQCERKEGNELIVEDELKMDDTNQFWNDVLYDLHKSLNVTLLVLREDPALIMMDFMTGMLPNGNFGIFFFKQVKPLICGLFTMQYNNITEKCEKSDKWLDNSFDLNPLAVGVLDDLILDLPDKAYKNVLLYHYQLDFFYDASTNLAAFAGVDMFQINNK